MRPIFIKKHEWYFANMVPISIAKHTMTFWNLEFVVILGSICWVGAPKIDIYVLVLGPRPLASPSVFKQNGILRWWNLDKS